MDTSTTSPLSLRTLMRRPLSALRPSPSVHQAAERCASILHHPRSRIRVTPGWQAPSLSLTLPAGAVTVYVSRHRVSPAMWRRLTGSGPNEQPPMSQQHLVTLTALAAPSEITGPVRNMTADVHSLFRGILLHPDAIGAEPAGPGRRLGPGVPWYTQDTCGAPSSSGRRLEWTWHALTEDSPAHTRPGPTGVRNHNGDHGNAA